METNKIVTPELNSIQWADLVRLITITNKALAEMNDRLKAINLEIESISERLDYL